jgi:hypothetical protein
MSQQPYEQDRTLARAGSSPVAGRRCHPADFRDGWPDPAAAGRGPQAGKRPGDARRRGFGTGLDGSIRSMIQSAFSRLAGPLGERRRQRIYKQMRAGPYTLKHSRTGAHDDLDRLLADLARERFGPGREVRVHDLAASSAISSIALLDAVSAAGLQVRLRASDRFDAISVVWLGGLAVVFDALGAPLQLAAFGVGIEPPAFLAPLLEAARRRLNTAARISLFHPEAHARAALDPRFTLAADDFYAPDPGPYEIVRLMNGVTQATPDADARRIIRAVARTVSADGLLVLGGRSGTAMLARTPGGFEEVARMGSGFDRAAFAVPDS